MGRAGRPRKAGGRYPNGQPHRPTQTIPSAMDDIFGDKSCAVYVMECEGRIKVGRSNNPMQRRMEIQVGNVNQVRVIWAARMTYENAKLIERLAHKWLKDRRSHAAGEWFRVAASYARDVVCGLVRKLGVAMIAEIDLFAEGVTGDGTHIRRGTYPHSTAMFQRALTTNREQS